MKIIRKGFKIAQQWRLRQGLRVCNHKMTATI